MTTVRVRFTPNGTPTPGQISFVARHDEDNRPIVSGRDILDGNPEWEIVPVEGADVEVRPNDPGWHYVVRVKPDGHPQKTGTFTIPPNGPINFGDLVRYDPKAGMAYEPDPDWWAHLVAVEVGFDAVQADVHAARDEAQGQALLAVQAASNAAVETSGLLSAAVKVEADRATVSANMAGFYSSELEQVFLGGTEAINDAATATFVNSPSAATRAAIKAGFVSKGEIVADARTYGAVPDGVTDCTAAIQQAIDEASENAFLGTNGVVYLAPGTYKVSTITAKMRVTLRGAGRYKTILSALPSSTESLIQMPGGPVQAWYVEDVMVAPGAEPNPGQHGVYMYARLTAGRNDAGWWYGGMRRVRVMPFDGHNIWLRGGGTDYMRPHQFLTFEQVESFNKDHVDARGMYITGQVGQSTFDTCQFDGAQQGTIGSGIGVEIRREVDNSGNVLTDATGYALHFAATTFQANAQGVRVDRAGGNTWTTCWFEDLLRGISFSTSSEQSLVSGSSFSNAGANGSGTGYCISVGSNSHAHLEANRFAGEHDRAVAVNSTNGHVTGDIGYSTKTGFMPITGMTKQPAVSSGAIDLGRSKTAIITSGANISTILGKFITGDVVYIRATSQPFNFVSGGNISFGGRSSPMLIGVNVCATFVKLDLGTAWQLVSLSS